MGSGLIYAIIVVLWAIVLVPMWLRRHDAETESRSVDRFSSAMKILSRRSRERARASGPRSVVVPPATDSDAPIDLDAPATGAERPAYVKPTSRPITIPAPVLAEPRRAPKVAAPPSVGRPVVVTQTSAQVRRRRVILLALAAVLVAAGAAFALGAVGLWAPIAAFVLAAGYLVLVTMIAASARRRAEAIRRAELRAQRRGGVVQASSAWHDTVVLGRPAANTGAVVANDERLDDAGWRPTPVPVPTYVNAPAATVLPRELDRRSAGAWDAQSMLEQAAAMRTQAESARAHEIDAELTGDDVWGRATAASGDRDAVFDREWFESDFDSTSAEELAREDAARYTSRRRAVNE